MMRSLLAPWIRSLRERGPMPRPRPLSLTDRRRYRPAVEALEDKLPPGDLGGGVAGPPPGSEPPGPSYSGTGGVGAQPPGGPTASAPPTGTGLPPGFGDGGPADGDQGDSDIAVGISDEEHTSSTSTDGGASGTTTSQETGGTSSGDVGPKPQPPTPSTPFDPVEPPPSSAEGWLLTFYNQQNQKRKRRGRKFRARQREAYLRMLTLMMQQQQQQHQPPIAFQFGQETDEDPARKLAMPPYRFPQGGAQEGGVGYIDDGEALPPEDGDGETGGGRGRRGGGGSGQGGGNNTNGGGQGTNGGQGTGGNGSGTGQSGTSTGQPAPPINVSNDPANDHVEMQIAVNPTDPNNLVIASHTLDPTAVHIDTWFTTDGGQTWTLRRIDQSVDGVNTNFRFDPLVVCDDDGTFYVGYGIDTNVNSTTQGNTMVLVARSTDGGNSYQVTQVVNESKAGNVFNDRWTLATGPAPGNPSQQNVYIGWVRFSGNNEGPIMISGSVNGGATFSPPQQVSDTTGVHQNASPAVGPDGTVYVSFRDATNHTILFDSSPTFTGTAFAFGADRQVTAFNLAQTNRSPVPPQPSRGVAAAPVLMADRSGDEFNGRLYLIYPDVPQVGAEPNYDIFFRSSSDGGNTWTSPLRVNDDAGTFTQFNPVLSVDQVTGCVTASWRDPRNGNNLQVDVFAATSDNGGVSFMPNERITQALSDESGNSQPGFNNFAEYDGVSTYDGMAYFAWADNSFNPNGPKEVFFTSLELDCAAGRVGVGEDRFEPNETSDRARNRGSLRRGVTKTIDRLTIPIHANGLPDYDWFKFTPRTNGTVTVTMDTQRGGDLELHLFVLDGNVLQPRGRNTAPGVDTKTVTTQVKAGQMLYVEVKGRNSSVGVLDTGAYQLELTLT